MEITVEKDSSYFSQSQLVWRPADPRNTTVEVFRRFINHSHGLSLQNYHDLHKYSVEDYTFWQDLWQFLGITYSVPPEQIIAEGPTKEIPSWFPGTRLNWAENVLGYRNDDRVAVTTVRETGQVLHYTRRELRRMVRALAAALRANGLQVGDRVAAVVTNSIHGAVIALATASVGGIFSSASPDIGTKGILDRYGQIKPKFLFAETEIAYGGKTINLLPKIEEVVRHLFETGLQQVVLLPSIASGKDIPSSIPRSSSWSQFLSTGDNRELTFEQLPFDQPLFILYSSGTSGPPKCMIQSAGGMLLNNKKDAIIAFGMNSNDSYLQYTTTSWMLFQFEVAALSCGTRIVMYDGSPFYPDVRSFLKVISDQGVSVFGTGPRFLNELQGKGIRPVDIAAFDSLRTVFSTGAALTAPLMTWTQRAFRREGDIHIMSACGGTDVGGAFMLGVPSLPAYAGEIQANSLGMKMEVFDERGRSIGHTGRPGEMVCTRPHPTMPRGFWGDESGEKLRSAYFDVYPGVWRQGDFMVVNPQTKGIMVLGRSDGVLNPSGVRFGSAEIYSVMEQFYASIDDSLCIGQRRPQERDERVLLFVKMRPGYVLNKALENKIRHAIRSALSPRHVPAYIFEVAEIPYTINNKKVEIAVKQIVSGATMKTSGTVANPESLKLYYKYRNIEQVLAEAGGQVAARL